MASYTVTRLWHIDENGKRRLFNTITPSSKFFGFDYRKDLGVQKNRHEVARILADGWRTNGRLKGTFEIEEGEPDPAVLSKMVSDIVEKSRNRYIEEAFK